MPRATSTYTILISKAVTLKYGKPLYGSNGLLPVLATIVRATGRELRMLFG